MRKETRFKYLDFTTIGFESLLYFFAGQTNKNYLHIKTLILNPVRTSPGRLKRLSSSSFWLSVGRLFNVLPALKRRPLDTISLFFGDYIHDKLHESNTPMKEG